MEPFDPEEQPRAADLTGIFPEGAERAAQAPAVMPPPPGEAAPPENAAPIQGTIRLADGLEASAPRDGVLFLIARSGDAGPPLAVKRFASPRFPLRFSIGPDDRMLRALPFQGAMQLSARLDRDGSASSREQGDLQGAAQGRYEPGARNVEIVIDEVL